MKWDRECNRGGKYIFGLNNTWGKRGERNQKSSDRLLLSSGRRYYRHPGCLVKSYPSIFRTPIFPSFVVFVFFIIFLFFEFDRCVWPQFERKSFPLLHCCPGRKCPKSGYVSTRAFFFSFQALWKSFPAIYKRMLMLLEYLFLFFLPKHLLHVINIANILPQEVALWRF